MRRAIIFLLLSGSAWIGPSVTCSASEANDGTHELIGPVAVAWESRHDGPGSSTDYAERVATDPEHSSLFVTGHSAEGDGNGCATVAYDPFDGSERWFECHGSPAYFDALAVSPLGSPLFVTGMATVAFDALTGDEIWRGGPGRDLVVSHDGMTLYRGDRSTMCIDPCGCNPFCPFYVNAVDSVSGTPRWSAAYGCGDYFCGTDAVALSPDGGVVFVAGRQGPLDATGWKSLVVAFDTVTSDTLWSRAGLYPRWSVGPDPLAVSPDGSTVFVAGTSGTLGGTAAYDATDGTVLWSSTVPGRSNRALAVTPDGTRVIVTGARVGDTSLDYLTTAFDALTGEELWSTPYDGPDGGDDVADAVALDANGATVWVTGRSAGADDGGRDFATVAYESNGGAPLWYARYDGPIAGDDAASSVAAAPDGSAVYVTGSSESAPGNHDYLTIAYTDIISVRVDVKPGSAQNTVNPRSRGIVRVAVLGSEDFDVSNIDIGALRFGPAEAPCVHGLGDPFLRDAHIRDVDLDGYLDLIGHFRMLDSGIVCGDTTATLKGRTTSGRFFEGSDSIRTVGCRAPRDHAGTAAPTPHTLAEPVEAKRTE